MATGASTCELAILLIDARKGVLDQTRRHSFISTLLGIKHLVVAINKWIWWITVKRHSPAFVKTT